MRYGVVFPNGDPWTRSGQDGLRSFAQAVEHAGFDYLAATDHVLGADSKSRPDWTGPYDAESSYREILTVLGFFAGATRLGLMSTILVLAQRQTAVVAKQVAELDLLTNGKIVLGIGAGWNRVEFEGLGGEFRTRGEKYEEQIAVLRLLWTQPVVSFEGAFHHIDRAGILPLPIQQPIPLWLGGLSRQSASASSAQRARVIDRIGRLGDGFIAGPHETPASVTDNFGAITTATTRAGRDPGALGLQVVLNVTGETPSDEIEKGIEAWRAVGATDLTIWTRRCGLSLEQNIDLIGRLGEIKATAG